jgi:hypothetical protein
MPGFSWPIGPKRNNFMEFAPVVIGGSETESAVDDVDCAGGEAGFVAREVKRECRNFLGGAEAAHGLARHEGLAGFLDIAARRDALVE